MRATVSSETGNGRVIEATPRHLQDFCEYCGDCLYCYGGDPCYGNDEPGEHAWVIYDEENVPVDAVTVP